MSKSFPKKKYEEYLTNYKRGMTLIELMVVIAIFMIITGVSIFNYGNFRSTISLQNLADDIALSVRKAQNYAIGVHSSLSQDFSKAYGIHFVTTAQTKDTYAGSNKSFIIFSDINQNGVYTHTPGDAVCGVANLQSKKKGVRECVELLTINTNDVISEVCPNGINCNGGTVDITFQRPNPDASIWVANSPSPSFVSSVDIKIKNLQTQVIKIIRVTNVGQISIQ